MGQARPRAGQFLADGGKHRRVQPLGEVEDVLAGDKAHLKVNLRELRLPVGAHVLIAQAPGDLKVPVAAGDHQQLLEDLRRLRERVEVAGADAAGHEVVSRALRGRPEQERRLDLEEALIGEELARGAGGLVTDAQVPLHPRRAEVKVAVLQPHLLIHLSLVLPCERRRLGGVEDRERIAADIDLPGRQVRVLSALGAPVHCAAHRDDELRAQVMGERVRLLVYLRVKDHLYQTGAVAQVDEDQASVIAAAVDPAVKRDRLPNVLGAQLAALVGSLEFVVEFAQSDLFAHRTHSVSI